MILEVGCWSSPASGTPEVPKKPSTELPGDIAERMLRADAPFDLQLPQQTPPRRHAASAALLTACRAGHHWSCWTLLYVATDQEAVEIAFLDIVAQCQKGDLSSCQAIPPVSSPHPLVPAGLPGELGRSLFGKGGRPPDDEEAAQLRLECRDGFPHSCAVLAGKFTDPADRREMLEHTSLAAREGCRRKNFEACRLVESHWPAQDRLAALDWNCVVHRSRCNELGAAQLALGRRDDARNAYERACQYGRRPELCLELAELYREGKLIEPVKDRGKTLVRLACKSLETDGYAGDYDECASSR